MSSSGRWCNVVVVVSEDAAGEGEDEDERITMSFRPKLWRHDDGAGAVAVAVAAAVKVAGKGGSAFPVKLEGNWPAI